jgi:hypothetical protein
MFALPLAASLLLTGDVPQGGEKGAIDKSVVAAWKKRGAEVGWVGINENRVIGFPVLL